LSRAGGARFSRAARNNRVAAYVIRYHESSAVKRFPFLDWMRGLAVVLMIQCHAFNSFAKPQVRQSDIYVLSQFIGGMAAPLFLFMAGMTLAFQMDSLTNRGVSPRRRWVISFRRGAYVLGIAYLFRISNFIGGLPRSEWAEIVKVDILNCMGVALIAFAAAAVYEAPGRVRCALAGALAIAAVSPVIANLPWGNSPALLRDYLTPRPGTGHFPFFPYASYAGFGVTTGTIVKQAVDGSFDRLMQWSVLAGFALILGGQYVSNIPYSIYTNSDFWSNSPTLILIRVGICLLLMAGSYLWTDRFAGLGWSWMRSLGKNSLMVYWIHVQLVYSDVLHLKGTLNIRQTIVAALTVMALMVALSAAWIAWKERRASSRKDARSGGPTVPVSTNA